MLDIFELWREWEHVESWLVNEYTNKLFWITRPLSSTDIIKQS